MDDPIPVTINGRLFVVDGALSLSFRDVADLAGFKSPSVPSMTLQQKPYEGRILAPGQSVRPRPGMVFNVADTSNA